MHNVQQKANAAAKKKKNTRNCFRGKNGWGSITTVEAILKDG
jgi:hypothetical protein